MIRDYIDLQNWSIKRTGVARNFDWEGPKLENFSWGYFGDVFRWRNGDDVTEMTLQLYILKLDLVIISFKNHYLA